MSAPPHRRSARWAAGLALLALAGCAGVGPQRLDSDQMGYADALGEGLKRQLLLNMVRLRYADVPTFLSVSQVISGYQVQGTAQAGLNAYPNAAPGNYVTLGGTMQYTARPTFTLTPVSGERFARSYLRPLAPAELLSLVQSGAPVDLLLRLGVQSVNGLTNGGAGGGTAQDASAGFNALMGALRAIQAGGAVTLRFERRGGAARVFLLLEPDHARTGAAARQVRRLLGAPPGRRELEVVYGRQPRGPGEVAVLTRSVLQILYELGAQIEVAEADVTRGETRATTAGERLVRIRQGERAPPDAYAAVSYRGRAFWIEAGDFGSKAAFTFAHVLQVLAESDGGGATPIVTIPTQ